MTHVTGIDVPLGAIIEFTSERFAGQGGYSFVINRDQRVVDASGAADAKATRTATRLELDFLNGWREAGSGVDAPFFVTSEENKWWVDFRSVSNDSARLWLAVGVPETSLAKELRGRQHQLALLVLSVLMIGVLLTILGTHAMPESSGEGLELGDEQALLNLVAGGEGNNKAMGSCQHKVDKQNEEQPRDDPADEGCRNPQPQRAAGLAALSHRIAVQNGRGRGRRRSSIAKSLRGAHRRGDI